MFNLCLGCKEYDLLKEMLINSLSRGFTFLLSITCQKSSEKSTLCLFLIAKMLANKSLNFRQVFVKRQALHFCKVLMLQSHTHCWQMSNKKRRHFAMHPFWKRHSSQNSQHSLTDTCLFETKNTSHKSFAESLANILFPSFLGYVLFFQRGASFFARPWAAMREELRRNKQIENCALFLYAVGQGNAINSRVGWRLSHYHNPSVGHSISLKSPSLHFLSTMHYMKRRRRCGSNFHVILSCHPGISHRSQMLILFAPKSW